MYGRDNVLRIDVARERQAVEDYSRGRKVPHNIEAEQGVLGAILMNSEVFGLVAETLEPLHFFDPLHKQIYETAAKFVAAGRRVDPVTLRGYFDNAPAIEPGLTVPQYLGLLTTKAPPTIALKDYASEIVDASERRRLILIAEDLASGAYEATLPVGDIVRCAAGSLELAQSNDSGHLKPIDLTALQSAELSPRQWLIEGLLAERSIGMLYAWRGAGKTWAGLGIGIAAAVGGQFLKWKAPRPCRVLHVCGEMPAIALRERLSIIAAGLQVPEGNFNILSADLHEHGLPDLATPEGQAALDAQIRRTGAELVILDNVSTLMRTGIENESEGWLPVQTWLLSLRRQGRSTIVIHHANKARGQRGTSRREDVLDVVLNLRQPQDYDPSQGARFEVHFEKARGLHGDAVEPFEASLEIRDGRAVWATRELADAHLADIEELREQGRTVRQIATELGMSKSAVQRALAKSACPAVPPLGSGTAGQVRGGRDERWDGAGTSRRNDQANQYRQARDGGT